MELTWAEKWKALVALDKDAYLTTTSEGTWKWFVSIAVEIKKGAMLHSGAFYAEDPVSAVHLAFKELTKLNKDEYLVKRAYSDSERKAVKWNGFMWEDVKEKNV